MNAQWRETIQRCHSALASGDLITAETLAGRIVQQYPNEPNALLLLGIAAAKSGRPDEALDWLARSAAASPFGQQHQSLFWQGNVERARGNAAAAIAHYQAALDQRPQLVDARFNLAATFRQSGDVERSAREYVRIGRHHPEKLEASQAVVNCAAELARTGHTAPNTTTTTSPVGKRDVLISFIVCSINPEKLGALRASIERSMTNGWELIHIPDARSLCEGNNRGMQHARGELLVFCHDDIEIIDKTFEARLRHACDDADVVGVAGTTLVNGPAVAWAGSPHVHGRMTHVDYENGGLRPSISSLAPARVDGAQALDGVLIAAWRPAAERIGFDQDTFDGFHFYDLDFSYRAWRMGLRTRIQTDLLISHRSRGSFDDAYWRYAARFQSKFPHLTMTRQPGKAAFFEAFLPDQASVSRMQAWISHWLD
jgi:hypothetical protein